MAATHSRCNRDVVGRVLDQLAEVQLLALPTPPVNAEQIDASRYVRDYEADVVAMTVVPLGADRGWNRALPPLRRAREDHPVRRTAPEPQLELRLAASRICRGRRIR